MEHKMEQTGREDPRAWNDNRERKPAAPAKAIIVSKAASFREKLREASLPKKAVFGLMVAAAVLTMIVGFKWGGLLSFVSDVVYATNPGGGLPAAVVISQRRKTTRSGPVRYSCTSHV